jgi:L-asparaginase II
VTHQVLARAVRSGFVESEHHGVAVALAPDGELVVAAGAVDQPVLPRSANKPLQACALLRAGLQLDGPLLALASASHSGERYHRDGVRRILASGGLDEDALDNTPGFPLDEDERLAWRQADRPARPIAQNCSGKHAAMVVTCVENGWPVAGYRSPKHPVQVQIAQTIADLAGEAVAATGVDGCGAPVSAISLHGLARAFARIATAPADSPEGRLATAIRRHPEWLGGTGRGVTRLIWAMPGLIAKDGAEAVFAAALPSGAAVAVKITDGGERAVLPVVVALLRRLGVDDPDLDPLADVPVLGHGARVGRIQPIIPRAGR